MNAPTDTTHTQAANAGTQAWTKPHVTEVAFTVHAATAQNTTPARLWGIVQATEGHTGLPWHGKVQAARLKALEEHRAREAEIAEWVLAELVSSVS